MKELNYVASLMAGRQAPDDAPGILLIHHAPMMMESHSLEDALMVAKEGALATFPIERGWQDHHVVVCAVEDLTPGKVISMEIGEDVVSSVVWEPSAATGAPASADVSSSTDGDFPTTQPPTSEDTGG